MHHNWKFITFDVEQQIENNKTYENLHKHRTFISRLLACEILKLCVYFIILLFTSYIAHMKNSNRVIAWWDVCVDHAPDRVIRDYIVRLECEDQKSVQNKKYVYTIVWTMRKWSQNGEKRKEKCSMFDAREAYECWKTATTATKQTKKKIINNLGSNAFKLKWFCL